MIVLVCVHFSHDIKQLILKCFLFYFLRFRAATHSRDLFAKSYKIVIHLSWKMMLRKLSYLISLARGTRCRCDEHKFPIAWPIPVSFHMTISLSLSLSLYAHSVADSFFFITHIVCLSPAESTVNKEIWNLARKK